MTKYNIYRIHKEKEADLLKKFCDVNLFCTKSVEIAKQIYEDQYF